MANLNCSELAGCKRAFKKIPKEDFPEP